MIKAVVFDLDHTLFDRYATIKKIIDTIPFDELPFNDTLSRDEIFETIKYAEKEFIYSSFRQVIDYFYKNGMLKSDADLDNYYNKYIKPHYMKTAVPFDFTKPTLRTLREMGIRVALITNGQPEIQHKKIELLGLQNEFEHILVGGNFGIGKPEPAIFDEMARLMKLNPTEMLYVGDHPKSDVWGSRCAGYTPVWVKTIGTWPYDKIKKPELQVETVAEIPEIVRKLNSI